MKDLKKKPTFEEFLKICTEANELLKVVRRNPIAQGRRPISLKIALIHCLAVKKRLNITLNQLYLIYGKAQHRIIENKKVIKQILKDEEIVH